jgi:hypothetical protein
MRDPARIDAILATLGAYWRLHPDLRLAQILGNTHGKPVENYQMEDEALIDYLGGQRCQISPPAPTPREATIAHLRSLPAEGLLELLREARVCVRWGLDDDERGDGPYRYLASLGGVRLATVPCADDGGTYGESDLEGERAAEDAAIAAGYRVPWRQE